jgi:hypothetical protein
MKAEATAAAGRSVSDRTGAWNLIVVGYAAAAVGLLINLPAIGSSGPPAAVSIGSACLIVVGIVMATAGLLLLRQALDPDRRAVRRGLAMQGLGLVDLLLGVLAIQISSMMSDRDLHAFVVLGVLLVGAISVVSASALAIGGGLLLKDNYSDVGATSRTDASYLILATALIFIGVGVVLGSKIGYYLVFSDLVSTVANVAGVALSACGCVVAAYSSFMMRGSGPVSKVRVLGGGRVSRWRPSMRRTFSSRV